MTTSNAGVSTANPQATGCLTKQDVRRMVTRGVPMEISWNYERQMHMAFCYMMVPALKKIYEGQPEKYTEALHRHMEFFNITPQIAPLVGGIVCAMEEQNAATDDFDVSAITNLKVALMGPLSGIFDAIFLGGILVIASGIGISLSQQGSILGPIAYLLIYNIPAYWLRYWSGAKGYEMGTSKLTEMQQSGVLAKVMHAASIVGIMVVGCMSMDMVYVGMTLQIGMGEGVVVVQELLDSIAPGLLPLGVTWLYYWLLKKKVQPLTLLVCTMIFGVICAYFGILG